MKLLIVVAFFGVALATPPLYNLQDLQGDDSLDATNYIDPDAIAVGIVNNDLEPSIHDLQELIEVADNYLKEKALELSEVPRNEENALGVDPINEPEPVISQDSNLRGEIDADKVLVANNDDEIVDTDKVLDSAPALSYDTNGDDTRQYDVIQIADVPFGNIPDEKSVDQLQIVDLNENNDDSQHFAGIMQIAPSELDSLRVEIDDDMRRELLDNQVEEVPQMPRYIVFSDPNLR